MAKLDDIKTIIDEELDDLCVTSRLINKTMERVSKPKHQWISFVQKYWMRTLTLSSSFAVVFILSLNFFGNTFTPSPKPTTPLSPSSGTENLCEPYSKIPEGPLKEYIQQQQDNYCKLPDENED